MFLHFTSRHADAGESELDDRQMGRNPCDVSLGKHATLIFESGILVTVVDSLPPVCERVCVRRLHGPCITDRTQ